MPSQGITSSVVHSMYKSSEIQYICVTTWTISMFLNPQIVGPRDRILCAGGSIQYRFITDPQFVQLIKWSHRTFHRLSIMTFLSPFAPTQGGMNFTPSKACPLTPTWWSEFYAFPGHNIPCHGLYHCTRMLSMRQKSYAGDKPAIVLSRIHSMYKSLRLRT